MEGLIPKRGPINLKPVSLEKEQIWEVALKLDRFKSENWIFRNSDGCTEETKAHRAVNLDNGLT